jgi:hypothetical protein
LAWRFGDVHSDGDSVVSRPGASWWVAAAMFLVMAGIFAAGAFSILGDVAFVALCGVLAFGFAVGAFGTALFAARAVICAGPDGLCWRGVAHGWRSAPWSAVSDYFWTLPSQHFRNGRAATVVIETSAGRIRAGADWANRATLEALVARRAAAAKANGWKLFGTRPGDAPQTFSYDTSANRRDAILLPAILGSAVAAILVLAIHFLAQRALGMSGMRPNLLIPSGLAVALVLAAGCGLVSITVVARWTERRRRRGEKITVSADGIRFQSRDREFAAAWEDVTGYGVEAVRAAILMMPCYIIDTRHGGFDFLATLNDRGILMACIAQQAIRANGSWRDTMDGALIGRPDLPEAGGRVFHYRTRTNRAFLALALFVAGAVVFEALWKRDDWGLLVAVPLAVAASGWLLSRYLTVAIRTNEAGITQYAPFRTRFIPWSALAGTRLHDSDQVLVETLRGGGETVRFWETISDVDGLREEIRRRVAAG